MNKEQIKLLFADDTKQRAEAIRKFVMDTSNSYEDRLEVFKETPYHLQHRDSWIISLPKFEAKHGEICWYSDFHRERYEDVNLTDILDYKDWPEEKEREFMEEVLELGVWSFNNDW